MDPRAQQLIERLGLEPHPEGGFFREHFRAAGRVDFADFRLLGDDADARARIEAELGRFAHLL